MQIVRPYEDSRSVDPGGIPAIYQPVVLLVRRWKRETDACKSLSLQKLSVDRSGELTSDFRTAFSFLLFVVELLRCGFNGSHWADRLDVQSSNNFGNVCSTLKFERP